MPADLAIRNVPDDVVRLLKERARRHGRRLERELLAIIENAVGTSAKMSVDDVLREVRHLGLKTPSEAVRIVRAARDGR